jgi:hypothetical protein
MKNWTSTLLVALATTLGGCAVAAPASAPRSAALALSEEVAAAPAPRSAKASLEVAALPAAPLPTGLAASQVASAPLPSAKPACMAETARGFTGFYATDTWSRGEVVLTFDDGPHPKGTPRVLDLLAEHRMPATFFVVGRAISRETYPLVQRIVREGHTLGSHSYSHDVHMTRVAAPAAAHEDILGQHQVTAILIDLALLATSGDDFDAMFRGVFHHDPATWLAASQIRKEHHSFAARHGALLAKRGSSADDRPYDVLYSRPPGGGPYVEHDGAAGVAIHDGALADLSMMNVMWHGASGDTDPTRRADFAFLTGNIERTARNGGVLLIHDYIRADALAHGLATIAADPALRVIAIDEAVQRKFGCDSRALGAELRAEGPGAEARLTLAGAAAR